MYYQTSFEAAEVRKSIRRKLGGWGGVVICFVLFIIMAFFLIAEIEKM